LAGGDGAELSHELRPLDEEAEEQAAATQAMWTSAIARALLPAAASATTATSSAAEGGLCRQRLDSFSDLAAGTSRVSFGAGSSPFRSSGGGGGGGGGTTATAAETAELETSWAAFDSTPAEASLGMQSVAAAAAVEAEAEYGGGAEASEDLDCSWAVFGGGGGGNADGAITGEEVGGAVAAVSGGSAAAGAPAAGVVVATAGPQFSFEGEAFADSSNGGGGAAAAATAAAAAAAAEVRAVQRERAVAVAASEAWERLELVRPPTAAAAAPPQPPALAMLAWAGLILLLPPGRRRWVGGGGLTQQCARCPQDPGAVEHYQQSFLALSAAVSCVAEVPQPRPQEQATSELAAGEEAGADHATTADGGGDDDDQAATATAAAAAAAAVAAAPARHRSLDAEALRQKVTQKKATRLKLLELGQSVVTLDAELASLASLIELYERRFSDEDRVGRGEAQPQPQPQPRMEVVWVVPAAAAATLFELSGLPTRVLERVWDLAAWERRVVGSLTAAEFFTALGETHHAHASCVQLLLLLLPPPMYHLASGWLALRARDPVCGCAALLSHCAVHEGASAHLPAQAPGPLVAQARLAATVPHNNGVALAALQAGLAAAEEHEVTDL
jgi:hypothetical protein